jgi:carbon monoxide dehydrogenase subunit G
MKTLKNIALVVLLLVVLLVLVSFMLPSQVHVERALTINAPPEKVFEQINTLKNWEKWSPWHKLDPNMKLEYEGAPAGVGAKYTWESQQRNVGSGSLAITQSTTNYLIQTAMDFGGQGQAKGTFKLEKEQAATKVTWSMDSDLGKSPIAKFFGLLMDKMVGPDFEKGLNNLKSVSEAK